MIGTVAGAPFITPARPNGVRWWIEGSDLWLIATHTDGEGHTVDLGQPLANSVDGTAADPSGWDIVLDGDGITYPAGLVGTSSSLASAGQYWGFDLADLGITFPSGQYRLTFRNDFDTPTGSRGGADVSFAILTSVDGFATLQRGCGNYFPKTGTSNSLAYLIPAGAALTNTTGTSNVLGCALEVEQGVSWSQPNYVHRIESGVSSNVTAGTAGYSTATQFTHVALWAYVHAAGTTTGSQTVPNMRGSMRWLKAS